MAITSPAGKPLIVKSPAFANNERIPAKYTCKGDNVNPSLTIDDIPANTQSLALIMDDPDAPSGTYVHWVMWNIPVSTPIGENSAPGTQGRNSRDESKYTGPCPPSGTHRYFFKVYALDTRLNNLGTNSGKQDLLNAMQGHVLASGELVGLYGK